MKVLLVDDEPMVVDSLLNLISWKDNGFEVVGSAHDGKTALQQYHTKLPELMIVDIRMPGMDGLELMRAVASVNPAVKFIVMSAYKDFEYAQQAIELGVSSYVVKHTLDAQKLLEELAKVRDVWKEEGKARQYLLQNQIKSLVTKGEADRWRRELPDGRFVLLLIQPDIPYIVTRKLTKVIRAIDLDAYVADFPSIAAQSLTWNLVGGFAQQDNRAVLLLSSKANSTASMQEELQHIMFRMQKHFRQQQTTASIFYAITNEGPHSLPHMFDKIILAANHAIFFGREAKVCIHDFQFQAAAREEEAWGNLVQIVELRDWNAFIIALERRFDSLMTPPWNMEALEELVVQLCQLLKTCCKRREAGCDSLQSPFEQAEEESLYHIRELYSFFLRRFKAHFDDNDNRNLSPRLTAVLKFIHSHYHEDITIESMAQAIEISTSYIHLLFKKELGQTFLDYLTEYRLQKAKRILHSEKAKMSEVAGRVGYRSAQYFSQVFKKHTGMLPHEFRGRG